MDLIDYPDLKLRKFVIGHDEKPLFRAISGPLVARHMATQGITLSDCEIIVRESLEHWDTHGIGSWAVEVEKAIVGWAGFKHWREQEFELLIVLSPNHWGLGKGIFQKLKMLASKKFALSELVVFLPETRHSYRYIESLGFESAGKEKINGEIFRKFILTL